jgi:hypothetical protein
MQLRLIRGLSLGVVLAVAGLGCGQAMEPEGMLEPETGMTQMESSAHIVCSAEDPCPKGYLCISRIKCAPVCNTTADCAAGKTCTQVASGKACL